MNLPKDYEVEGQLSIFDIYNHDIWSGKTSPEHSVQTKEKISSQSSKKQRKSSVKMPLFLDLRMENGHQAESFWVMGGALLGEYTMHSFGEYPSAENVSLLSQILEETPHQKYCLSAKACQGILRRAEKRGKELPPLLKETLIRQASLSKSGGGVEVDSKGKKAGKGPLIQTELSGTLGVSQDQTLITKCMSVDEKMGQTYVGEEIGNTLGARDYKQPQAVVYGISSYDSNSMKSSNPHSGIYEADTTRTLDNNGGNPACNQGGMIVLEGNGQRDSHKGDGYKESETMYTLNTVEQHGVCYGTDLYNHAITGDIAATLNATSCDSRLKYREDGIFQTLSGKYGNGRGIYTNGNEDKRTSCI